jgi:CheY-like chemotaxis protein
VRRGLSPSPAISRKTLPFVSSPLVMIADDDSGIRGAMTELLKDAGYRVQGAGSGEDLLTLVRRQRPDALLLDLAMPGADGIETARAVRNLEGMEGVPIIAVTSSWLGDRIDLLAPAGFTAALRKPFGGQEVTELLGRALASPQERLLRV